VALSMFLAVFRVSIVWWFFRLKLSQKLAFEDPFGSSCALIGALNRLRFWSFWIKPLLATSCVHLFLDVLKNNKYHYKSYFGNRNMLEVVREVTTNRTVPHLDGILCDCFFRVAVGQMRRVEVVELLIVLYCRAVCSIPSDFN
jgi:hypothetical protein